MYLLDLKELQPGDIILEEGIPRVAAATGGGPFGHASIAIGRLLFVEADKASGVTISGFLPEIWSSGTQTTYAHQLPPAGAMPKVRRLKEPKPIEVVRGLALAEVGRAYSLNAATNFPNLTPSIRQRLLSQMQRTPKLPGPPNAPGRACSEVVAVILGLGATAISPNDLSNHSDFVDVPTAVINNTAGTWALQQGGIAAAEIAAALPAVGSGFAQAVHAAAQQVWASQQTPGAVPLNIKLVADQLEQAIDTSMVNSIKAMLSLDQYAVNLLR